MNKDQDENKDEVKEQKCKGKTEVFSRVTGFYRPVQQWNPGKTSEYNDRKTYKLKDEDKKKD